MAEFKLGRIRFVWKDVWSGGTTYIKDDVVRNGGKTYVCLAGHTANSNFYTDLAANKWDLAADGQEWKGNWAGPGTYYKVGDLVKNGAQLYICSTAHTSQATLEADIGSWTLFASSAFDWKNVWAGPGTYYKIGDVVKYGATVYRCKTTHTSQSTLEADQASWDIVNRSFEYLGAWSNATRYKLNDIVKYGGGLWICTTAHAAITPLTTFPEGNFAQLVEGFEFEDSWSNSAVYQPGDVVTYGGYIYVSKTNHTNQTPTTNSDDWDLFSTGFNFLADWLVGTAYKVGDVVRLNGYTYLAIADNQGQEPPNLTYWELLNPGYEWQGTWANASAYKQGDTAKYGENTYVCILAHTSDSGTNRPDVDVLGTYWNLLSAGSASSVLTTQGDIVYYSGSGPARLPIGKDGQVLRNTNGNLTWDTFGNIAGVYYVAPNGTDDVMSEYGITIDKPFKTIRYATEVVRDGARNLNAAKLLEKNRSFIQKEITAWINAQIAGPNAPFSAGFTYNTTKCERDMGYIVDALVWDITHGGNIRSRNAALEYVNNAPLFYLAGQKEETVAAINHGLTIIDAVISNVAFSNLQSTVTQVIDASLVEEVGVQTTINSLVSIITSAITAESATNIPAANVPHDTIFVKTGTFAEVLPIIVPADCALVGDELRSTVITPAGALVDSGDVTYSIAALERIAAVLPDIVQNISITKSSGNTLTQDTTRPAGTLAVGNAAAQMITDAKNYVDFYINSTGSAPTLAGSNAPTDTQAYYDAVAVLEENKEFLAAEATAYIDTTYPAYASSYDHVACQRDVRAFIDAVKYDLVYTGNYRTLLAAKYYVNSVTGSTTLNMFHFRNGSGLRNCTLQGLSGTLGAANSYGTKRPTAGAYASLDSGFGVSDVRAHITTKSPYIQNVTTFGTGCIGMKLDGDLHNAGNKSIVANDFTQILNDGIGIWVTNLARAELVSVFTYYAHIGYLAENGGKIRATNGNNSYGTFGSVSEGVDATETPITATVNNRAYEAQVSNTFTNGANILAIEYSNAGSAYTTTGNTYTFTGTGINAAATGNEIRDGAVFETRLLTSGADYVTISNTAQTGNTTTITIAGSDTNTSGAYVGMRIVIVAGQGVGQYGYINSYDSGTKIAQVYKETTGTAGWDHIVPGTSIVSTLDSTTTYSIEPRITFTGPAYAATARTISQSGAWVASAFGNGKFVAIDSTGLSTYSTNGTSWSDGGALPSATYTALAAGAIGASTYHVAVSTTTQGAYSTDGGTNWSSATLPSGTWSAVAYGNSKFVAITTGANTTAVSTNGNTWSAGGNLPSSTTWSGVAHGAGKFVAVAGGGSASTAGAYSTDDGATWTACTLPSAKWTSVTFGNNRFVAVAQGGTVAAYSLDGITWVSSTVANSSWKEVRYGQGTFLAITGYGGSASTVAASSTDGIVWTARALASAAWSTIAFGNPSNSPIWAILATGGTVGSSIPNFTTARARAVVQSGQLAGIRIQEPGSGYTVDPTMTITDPNDTTPATWDVRVGNGALANPTFTNRGTGYSTALTAVSGAGYADMYQDGAYVNVSNMDSVPLAGSNIIFNGDNTVYKLVTVTELAGSAPNYSARLQVSPLMTIALAPVHSTSLSIRYRYSQVRLTGHDYLDIGTGNIANTNYPGLPVTPPVPANETVEGGGGRVFYTSTDQDGNFRVGDLFTVEQATGVATLNADAFNLSGLQELQLGAVTLGSSNTAINEFSTDGTFTANSDSIVPTQRAIRTYIASQIGGGGSNLNVNTLTAGVVQISGHQITTTDSTQINVLKKMNFKQGVDGSPLALNYFLLR